MKKKIIIAETVQQIVTSGHSLFNRGGIALLPGSSCSEIIDLHRSNQADLIIADAGLPGMDGVRLCSSLRSDARLKNVSIIMICDRDDPSSERYRSAGSNYVMARPLDPAALFSTVSRMLMVQTRRDIRVPLRIRVDGKDGTETLVGMSRNISASGLLVHSGRPLRIGGRLECSFTINSRVITLESRIVREDSRSGERLYGVQFLNLDAKTFVLIEHFVKSSMPRTLH
jgi:DNA-binding response OmpR family regulator